MMITSLLQVFNRVAACCELHAGLMQVVSLTSPGLFNFGLNHYTAKNATDLMQVVDSTGLMQVVNKLYQAC